MSMSITCNVVSFLKYFNNEMKTKFNPYKQEINVSNSTAIISIFKSYNIFFIYNRLNIDWNLKTAIKIESALFLAF